MRKDAVYVGLANAAGAVIMAAIAIAVSSLGSVAPWVMAVIVVACVSLFAVTFPTQRYSITPGVSRIAAVAASVAGVIAGLTTATAEHFGIALFLLMTALIAGGFLFEMLRHDRSQLIKSLSSIIFMGTLGLVAAGWMVTSRALAYMMPHSRAPWYVLAAVIVGEIAICVCVALWAHDDLVDGDAETAESAESLEAVESDGAANVVKTSTIIRHYWAIAALLSGVFPLLIVLISGVLTNL